MPSQATLLLALSFSGVINSETGLVCIEQCSVSFCNREKMNFAEHIVDVHKQDDKETGEPNV